MMGKPVTLPELKGMDRLLRGRFELEYGGAKYVVDAHYLDLDERIRLYRDGQLVEVARRRARFQLDEGAAIEAAVSQVGMKYVRLRRKGIRETVPLAPAQGTAEAWRSRLDRKHPRASRAAGAAALVILAIVLLIELPQLVNLVGSLAPLIGLPAFGVPALVLPGWLNVALIVLGGAAGLERSLSMRYTPLLDD